MRIFKLPKLVINKIAAGEVINRPSSILKELLENSCDANSKQIDIFIEGSGLISIKVIDNGEGIYKDDLPLSILKNATSKINSIDDLVNLDSLGFRGEALSSIGSVSNLQLISKPIDQEIAWSIELKETNQCIFPAAHNNGTTVIINDLFHNIPVRRKFLKSKRVEFYSIEEVFKSIALSHFHIKFSFYHDNKLLKNIPKCMNKHDIMKRVERLCGKNIIQKSFYVNARQCGLHLSGWIGRTNNIKTQMNQQYFFINNRLIQSKIINHAIRTVYSEIYYSGRCPFYCLYLSLDGEEVDINVHPSKSEVRFAEEKVVHQFITSVIRKALSKETKYTPKKILNTSKGFSLIKGKTISEKKILGIFESKVLLVKLNESLLIINIGAARKKILSYQMALELKKNANLSYKCLPTPEILINSKALNYIDKLRSTFKNFGFDVKQFGVDALIIRTIPNILGSYKFNWQLFVDSFINCASDNSIIDLIVSSTYVNHNCFMQEAEDILDSVSHSIYLNDNLFHGSYTLFSANDLLTLT